MNINNKETRKWATSKIMDVPKPTHPKKRRAYRKRKEEKATFDKSAFILNVECKLMELQGYLEGMEIALAVYPNQPINAQDLAPIKARVATAIALLKKARDTEE